MSATQAVRHAVEAMGLVAGETLEDLARRLFYLQDEIYSAHMGSDLNGDFDRLDKPTRQAWLRAAERKRES